MRKLVKRNKSINFNNDMIMGFGHCHNCPCSQGMLNTIQNGFSLFL
ncbi:hypothetical protein [Enterococcus gallinarum]|nr:hypothetical protein [Enterococcus gallinarum]